MYLKGICHLKPTELSEPSNYSPPPALFTWEKLAMRSPAATPLWKWGQLVMLGGTSTRDSSTVLFLFVSKQHTGVSTTSYISYPCSRHSYVKHAHPPWLITDGSPVMHLFHNMITAVSQLVKHFKPSKQVVWLGRTNLKNINNTILTVTAKINQILGQQNTICIERERY